MNLSLAQIFAFSFLLLGSYSDAQASQVDLKPDDYRVYCGYLDAMERPEIQKLSPNTVSYTHLTLPTKRIV